MGHTNQGVLISIFLGDILSPIKKLMMLAIFGLSTLPSCTCAKRTESVKIDGSSTVYVISEAIAEEYQKKDNGDVSIGISGTGGGFKKLCGKRIDIIGASRAITESEKEVCLKNGVEFLELPVAFDGIVVVVNKENNFLNEIKVSTLKKIFEPEAEGKIMKWSDVDPAWPPREFEIFSPGISSGTYDYFTQAIVGKEHSSRGDLTSSEDDNVLVHGVLSTKDSIGFFSYAYYLENKDDLKALPIIDDVKRKTDKAVAAEVDTIQKGTYSPLSRKVFIYANKNLSEQEKKFLHFYLTNSQKIALDVGFVPLSNEVHQKALITLEGKGQ
jgi:phosphate transport system substrate-binding protein